MDQSGHCSSPPSSTASLAATFSSSSWYPWGPPSHHNPWTSSISRSDDNLVSHSASSVHPVAAAPHSSIRNVLITTSSNGGGGGSYRINNGTSAAPGSLMVSAGGGGGGGLLSLDHHHQHHHSLGRPHAAITSNYDKFEAQIRLIANEIQNTIQQHMNGLQTRKEQLLEQLETIRKIYVDVFNQRPNGGSLLDMDLMEEPIPLPAITFTKPDLQLQKAVSSLGFLTAPAFAPNCAASGEGLEFVVPGVNTSFVIVTKNCFGEDLLIGRENVTVTVTVIHNNSSANSVSLSPDTMANVGSSLATPPYPNAHELLGGSCSPIDSHSSSSAMSGPFSGRDQLGRSCSPFGGSSSPFGHISQPSSTLSNNLTTSSSSSNSPPTRTVVNHSLLDHNNGKYTVAYMVPATRNLPDRVVISVSINGMSLNGSPFRVPVRQQQRQTWRKVLTFGNEGNAIGQFCRPWGVAITRMPAELSARRRDSDGSTKIDSLAEQTLNISIQPPGQVAPTLQVDPLLMTIPASTASTQSSTTSATSITTSNNNAAPAANNSGGNGASNSNEYLLAVADRSNNRVQLFRYDETTNQLTVVNVFGSGPGTRHGQFDRPAGICFNVSLGHIIVADKDNHRVQVFDLHGRYLFKFGDKGNRVGHFCYPWDIDSCPRTHQIAVSDTRNRRVQLFTPYGQYIMHFAQPLDSPRGVGFFGDKLIVSDFNKHKLVIFDKFARDEQSSASSNSSHSSTSPQNPTTNRTIGYGEGSGWGEFLRPQGLSICGNFVFCSDSRNNRICLFNLNTQAFEYLTEDNGLDRPSGIASVDNILAVVDFGNNRVQLYQR